MDEYISREAALSEACHGCNIDFSCEPCEPQDCEIKARLEAIPAADVEPVRHAYWVKRMEERKGNGYEAFTPVWSCSDCGKDYDPATCSIIKYCFECGAKMNGGQDDV